MRSLGIVLVVGVLALLLAGPARAAGVRVVTECHDEGDSGGTETHCYDTATYTADPGEANDVTLSGGPLGVTVTDAGAPLTAGTGCVQAGPHEATCSSGSFGTVRLDLGDGADTFAASPSLLSPIVPVVSAGPGDDVVTGGPGGDSLYGGPGSDRLSGGEGSDLLDGDSSRTEAFPDVLDGGPGIDKLDYVDRTVPVTVDLQSPGSAGSPGEGDSVAGFENVRGGSGRNRLLGDDGPNDLEGGAGGNALHGRGGDDRLSGDVGSDLLDGGAGDDDLHGGFGTKPDRLLGGEGDDLLTGGEGPDRLDAGPGDDVVHPRLDFSFQRLGPFDSVRCGDGEDLLRTPYRALSVKPDCERVAAVFLTLARPTLLRGGRVAMDAIFQRNYRSDARPCAGRLTIRTAARYERGSNRGHPRRHGATPLAGMRFAWHAGERRTLVLRLPPAARARLERAGRMRTELVLDSLYRCARGAVRGPASAFTLVLRPRGRMLG